MDGKKNKKENDNQYVEKKTTTCHRAVRVRRDWRNDGREVGETCVRGCTPPPCYGERVERRRDIEWARRARHGHPLYQRPWHFATSQRIMKQHVGLRLYWRQGSCFASQRIVYCAALRCGPPLSPSAPAVLFALSCMIFALVLRRLILADLLIL